MRYFYDTVTGKSTREYAEASEWNLMGHTIEVRIVGQELPNDVWYGNFEEHKAVEREERKEYERNLRIPGGWKIALNPMKVYARVFGCA